MINITNREKNHRSLTSLIPSAKKVNKKTGFPRRMTRGSRLVIYAWGAVRTLQVT